MGDPFLISLGSNIEPEINLPRAISGLCRLGHIVQLSMVYETLPVGPSHQPHFLNAAVALESQSQPAWLRASLRDLEAEQGRLRGGDPYEPRPIDLDISLIGEREFIQGDFKVPDPHVLERGYLALVLSEVAPQIRYPGTERTLAVIAADLLGDEHPTPRPDIRRSMLQRIPNLEPASSPGPGPE